MELPVALLFGPLELLVQSPDSTEYRGYTFSQEKNLFEVVDAQIDFVGKTQGYTFLRVWNQLFVLKQNVWSWVTIIEQKIPKGMSLDQLRFVDDVVWAAFDAQMQDIDENFQRFYFDPQSCAIDFSKFSSLSYIYYWQKLGDIPLWSIGDTQISRLVIDIYFR